MSSWCSCVLYSCVPSVFQSLGLSWAVPEPEPSTLYLWRQAPAPGRVRRAWVIPPISVSENHKRLPYPLVQVREGWEEGMGYLYRFPHFLKILLDLEEPHLLTGARHTA